MSNDTDRTVRPARTPQSYAQRVEAHLRTFPEYEEHREKVLVWAAAEKRLRKATWLSPLASVPQIVISLWIGWPFLLSIAVARWEADTEMSRLMGALATFCAGIAGWTLMYIFTRNALKHHQSNKPTWPNGWSELRTAAQELDNEAKAERNRALVMEIINEEKTSQIDPQPPKDKGTST